MTGRKSGSTTTGHTGQKRDRAFQPQQGSGQYQIPKKQWHQQKQRQKARPQKGTQQPQTTGFVRQITKQRARQLNLTDEQMQAINAEFNPPQDEESKPHGKCFLNFHINICQSTIDFLSPMNVLCIDSGASVHVISDIGLFRQESVKPSSGYVECADGSRARIEAAGTVSIKTLILNNVLFVPSLKCNLISVPQLDQDGYTVVFGNQKCIISGTKLEKPIVLGYLSSPRNGNLYECRLKPNAEIDYDNPKLH